ncbi:hypothetical protein QBC43DRAFT_337576 [Cladorrhinum sp. PSN259]|nr:hypothetical protein QBC43DRAFT_337576 [Cladorrhinum sp. PSN259]
MVYGNEQRLKKRRMELSTPDLQLHRPELQPGDRGATESSSVVSQDLEDSGVVESKNATEETGNKSESVDDQCDHWSDVPLTSDSDEEDHHEHTQDECAAPDPVCDPRLVVEINMNETGPPLLITLDRKEYLKRVAYENQGTHDRKLLLNVDFRLWQLDGKKSDEDVGKPEKAAWEDDVELPEPCDGLYLPILSTSVAADGKAQSSAQDQDDISRRAPIPWILVMKWKRPDLFM